MTTTYPGITPLPCDPTERDWRWQLDTFHATTDEEGATATISLVDRDGTRRRGRGTGPTALHALIDGLYEATGYKTSLKSAKIFSARNGGTPRAQAQIILQNEAHEDAAGFGWAASEHDAFMTAVLRIINKWEAAISIDAYCKQTMPHHFRYLDQMNAAAA